MTQAQSLESLAVEISDCEHCPRLRRHCVKVAAEKRASFRDWDYWGRPVPGFGDTSAWLMVVGLAPAAHGANRTGRIFTGDRSGDFLYAALHRAGLASQATSVTRDDGLILKGAYISAAARCAPPENKPSPAELKRCLPYLVREMELLRGLRVVLTLGRIGHDAAVAGLRASGRIDPGARVPFAHGARWVSPDGRTVVVGSYHVSQQNTFTGRLTPAMFDGVLTQCRSLSQHG